MPHRTGENNVTTEGEPGTTQPQIQGYQQPLDTGRGKEESPPWSFWKEPTYQHHDFRILASRTIREYSYVILSHLAYGNLLQYLEGTNTISDIRNDYQSAGRYHKQLTLTRT